jgi:atypical dual specificity phosphatase
LCAKHRGQIKLYTMSRILNGLYVGDRTHTDRATLDALGISVVLSVGSEFNGPYQTIPYYDDILYLYINVMDEPGVKIERYFNSSVQLIHQALKTQNAILIHCAQGRSRSVTICAAYLISKHKMTAAQAIALIKASRPIASPNAGFIEQLTSYETTTPANQTTPQVTRKRAV